MPRKRLAAAQEKNDGKTSKRGRAPRVDEEEMELDRNENNNEENGIEIDGGRNRNDEERNEGEGGDGGGIDLENFLSELQRMEIPPPPPLIMNFDGTGPRLLITSIVNENFKSYYGRHTLGPFHKNFSSIVGPNGSGKSNVIDSLLFVFGYRAQKIRSKNISVLIHNSELHPNVGECTVEVHFVKIIDKPNDQFEEVPNSGFVIARTAYRDNSSVYYVNKKRVQFKEVGAMLRQHGIDIDHNRFLILQGEVEQISLMKPKAQVEGEEGMLEYLEDIVGSSRLKPFLDTMHKRIDELNEIRNEKAHRAKTVEEEKAALEGPKDEAVAFLELENDITRKKNVLFQRYLLEATESCSKMTSERDDMKGSFEGKEKEVQELKEEIQGKQKHYERLKKKHDEVQKQADTHAAAFRELEKEDVKLREDLKHCKGKVKTLEGSREAESKKLEDLKLQPAKCEKQLEELQQKIKDLETKRAELDVQLQEGVERLRGETKATQAEKKTLEEKLIGRQKGVADARQKLELANSELELCLSAQTREQTKFDDLKATLAKIDQTLDECKTKIEEAEKSIPEMDERFRKTERRIREVTVEERELHEQIRDKSSRVGTATANLQTAGNRSRVLDALFGQQQKGELKGIFGRLGDLGAIDEKYDVAISTACGLENIIVDKIDTAQSCVNFLKKNEVGMATFVGLDKMKKFENQMRQPFRAPENVPRLFDLIVVEDQQFLPAFYFALRDTLVANDLDQAMRIAYVGDRVRYRVVTLDGKMIELSGTMSGGGKQQSRGRMGRSIVATPNADDMTLDQLKRLENEIQTQRTRLDEMRTMKLQFETDRDKLGPELQKKKLDLNSWKMDVKALLERKQTIEKQLKSQVRIVAETVPDEREKKTLTDRVEVYQKEYNKVAEASAVIQAEVKKADDLIQAIKEKFVGSVEKELVVCRRQVEETEKAINKSKVAAKTALRNIKSSEEKLVAYEEDAETNKTNIERILERLKALEEEGATAVVSRDQALKDLKMFEADFQAATKGVRGLEDQLQKLETALMDHRTRLEHTEQSLKNLQQKKTYWERETQKLQLHDIRKMCGLPPEEPAKKNSKRRRVVDKETDNRNGDEEMENGEDEEQERANEDEESDDVGQLKKYSVEYLQSVDTKRMVCQVTVLEDDLKSMQPNLDALNEYRKKQEKYQKCLRQLDEVTKMRDVYRNRHEELRKQRLNQFLDGFGIISSKLKEMYQMITLGGDADLELVDTMDPFTEGIAFSVRPPKKSWKQISNLSGGEKTLSSLSLVFALHHYKPTPLYVMDEIDAALDFKNVSIVANYIKERTKNAQFIIISLRNNMFELADRLVGIYKTHHCTKSAVINPAQIAMPTPMSPKKTTTTTSGGSRSNILQDKSFNAEENDASVPVGGSTAAEPVPTVTDRVRMAPIQA